MLPRLTLILRSGTSARRNDISLGRRSCVGTGRRIRLCGLLFGGGRFTVLPYVAVFMFVMATDTLNTTSESNVLSGLMTAPMHAYREVAGMVRQ